MEDCNYTHDRLLQEMYMHINNTYPDLRGCYFHVPNELKPHPGEPKRSHIIRLSKLKAIGTLAGVVDHLLIFEGVVYGFDAKIAPDKLKAPQIAFIEMLRKNGGNGWAIYTIEQFKTIIHDTINSPKR